MTARGPHPDFIVVRAAPEARTRCPEEFIEGKWFDRRDIPAVDRSAGPPHPAGYGRAKATPTGELVTRDDGAVGEIWELTIP